MSPTVRRRSALRGPRDFTRRRRRYAGGIWILLGGLVCQKKLSFDTPYDSHWTGDPAHGEWVDDRVRPAASSWSD
jgi:hypothetical protein